VTRGIIGTQHKGPTAQQCSSFMLSVVYAECRYVECHYAECRGALKTESPPLTVILRVIMLSVTM
jgi:hypothetical protein